MTGDVIVENGGRPPLRYRQHPCHGTLMYRPEVPGYRWLVDGGAD